jgi:putative ABC transport system permease protein
MFRTYVKTTFRNLWNNRAHSFLNIAGLAVGIACAGLILLYVEDELTYNHNFKNRDLLYRVMENQKNEGKILTSGSTPGPLAESMRLEISGIKNSGRLSWNMDELFVLNDKSIKENGAYADPSILSMLSLPFVYGDPVHAFDQPQSVVISATMARKFFGLDNPMGKILSANGKQAYSVDGLFTITGVYADLPQNSTYQFQWISPYSIFENKNDWIKPWDNNLTETLVELQPSANLEAINKIMAGWLVLKTGKPAAPCFLFSMNDWNLRNHFTNGKSDGGSIKYVQLFTLIAGIILLIACINFMNLATARSEKRAREVGVRKLMGAGRKRLVFQFIGESLALSFLSVAIALVMLYISLPAFNSLVKKNLSVEILSPVHWISLVSIGALTGLLAGSYPAFYLSSFNPIGVLKGVKIKTRPSAIFIRRGLVISQFAISIALMICTTIIYQQIQHIRERDLGYNKENLIEMDLQGTLLDHFDMVRNKLLATGFVENAALSLHGSLKVYSYTDRWSWEGKEPNHRISIHSNVVSPQYLSTLHLEILKGRDFYSIPKIDSDHIIINESMAKLMGKQGKLGSALSINSTRLEVVGIVKDFIFNDIYAPGNPIILLCNPNAATLLTIRFKPQVDLKVALSRTEAVISAENPGYPFQFQFVDEEFNQLFASETLIGKLAALFAVLAVFISCLGLFGLASYTAERRTKELGIRKVLGASTMGLTGMLSKEFLRLVAISCVIAFPLAWWAMNIWLLDFQYRIDIQVWVFILSGITALGIAMGTVIMQSVRAAWMNPVRSLRME